MKKIGIVLLAIVTTLTLTGCSNDLENTYFENPEADSWEDTEAMFVSYMFKVKSHYETYNKSGDNRALITNYLDYEQPEYLDKDILTRTDFVNYSLSDDLDYMQQSNLHDLYYDIETIVNHIKDYCSDMKEGNVCKGDGNEMMFQTDTWDLFIEFTKNVDAQDQIIYQLHFTRNEANQVTLNANIEVYQNPSDGIYKLQTVTLIEDVLEENEEIMKTSSDNFLVENTLYTKTSLDLETGIYTFFQQDNEFETSGYYNTYLSFYQEISFHYEDKDFLDFKHIQYIDNILAYKYDEGENLVFLNLLEFIGWNNLVKNGDSYDIYLNDVLVSTTKVTVEQQNHAEYPYIILQGSSVEDVTYFDDVDQITLGINLSVMQSARTDNILSYADLREYMTENKTLEEHITQVQDEFPHTRESK